MQRISAELRAGDGAAVLADQRNAFKNSLTTDAELSETSCANVSISLSCSSPPARSERLRKAMNGTLLA